MLRTYFQETFYDMDVEIARKYAEAIKAAIILGQSFEGEKKQGFFISKNRGFEDKLYVGNVKYIEDRLEWNGEELADDDEIINVIVIDGPVTRDGDGCSYGSKDHRDQILYANTIPQVVGHIFIINTPGGAASARIDYEQAIADCREKGKPTVAWVDGMCCSAGQLVASLCDRTIAMNGRDTMGCIGTMCAFWGVANGTVDKDGYRYIELVSVTSPDTNAEYREACDDKLGEEFRETVKATRPLVKDEHLTGKTFDAQDVMGALVDEIGDYTRAIECVFELAGGTMPAAREGLSPGPSHVGEGSNENANEIGNTQNDNNMTNEQKMAAEAEAAQAAAQEQPTEATAQPEATEAPATEQPATEQPATEEPGTGEGTQEPAAGEGAQEGTGKEPMREALENAEAEINRISETLQNTQAMYETEHEAHVLLQGEVEKLNADYQAKSDAFAKLAEEHNAQSADLTAAQALIAERDKTIETLQGDMEVLKKSADEKDAAIAELQKKLDEKEAEIKELADKPTPMANGDAGIPADNGTGEAPVQKGSRIKPGMSYEEIRQVMKQQ